MDTYNPPSCRSVAPRLRSHRQAPRDPLVACPTLPGREDALDGAEERTIALAGRRVPIGVVAGLLLAAVAWALIVAFCEPFGRLWGTGQDARSYWAPSLADPYANANWTTPSAYPYSPIFLQVLQPIRLLPWEGFIAVWTAILLAALAFLTGPRLLAVGIIFAAMELAGGNIELLLAAAIVVGFRYPSAWAFVLLTKVTPGVGLLWFAVRREWRALGIALGTTAAVVAISAVVAPDAWLRWPGVLAGIAGRGGTWAAVPVPLLVRLPVAVAIIVWGARTDRRWTVVVGGMLALPALWYGGFSMLLAVLPLVAVRTPADLVELIGTARDRLARVRRAGASRAGG
ncbi:MAG: DUF2029 domain-containing protein [Chloroflexi bacterium]|nr:MAG: DUF2029 domain-containing protein [Chloroflexota bacterium]